MITFDQIAKQNSHLSFYQVTDSNFLKYGKVLEGYDFSEIKSYMNDMTGIPEEGNRYIASVEQLEETSVKNLIQTNFYGDMPIQIGYCNGRNSTLNGLEYHKGSEINIAVTDLVLLLGCVQDIKDNTYSVDGIEAFFIPKGTAVELFGTTLHFAPCKVTDEGFKTVVILPAGTNEQLDKEIEKVTPEDKLLFMKNKWLIAHPERTVLIEKGAHGGIKGENLQVKY